VASGACGGEADCSVRRIIGPAVIGFVARVAIGRYGCVVVIRVALCAGHRRVEAGQREHSRVIERRRSPVGGRVTESTVGWEACGHMGGIRGSREIHLVAAIAGRWQRGVVVIGVALCARDSNVRTGQRERCVVVIKGRCCPGRGVVASSTCGREAR